MTVLELATRPEVKLGGTLLAIDIIAVLLCAAVLAGLIVAPRELHAVGGRFMIAVGFIALWSGAFVIMTWQRVRSTPTWSSIGIVVWVLYRFAVAIAGGYGWPLAVDSLGELVMAAAFCGYMAAGVRPNAYYRRRLPKVGPV